MRKKVIYGHTAKFGKRLGKIIIPNDKAKGIITTYLTQNDIASVDADLEKKINSYL